MVRGLSRAQRRAAAALAAACVSTLFATRSPALDIVLVYNAGASNEPAGDPTGAQLTAIMQRVESFYQDVFETAHTITINYWYEALGAPNLAVHNLVSQAAGRETEGNIRFDPSAQGNNWFWDPTPADNSEFTMSQTLFRDLAPATQTDLYNFTAPIPSTFEAGFTGGDNGSDTNVAGNTDMLSVAFHEMGHSLGMSGANTTTQTETGDNDYDFDSVNVFGATLAAQVADGANIAHLDGSGPALMNPSIGTGIRRLPSHTDMLSMAAVHNYTDLDMPRREFYGGTNWNLDANWTGNTVPGSADEAFVRASGPAGETRTAGLTAAGSVGTLNVSEASNVDTNAFQLSVFSAATIDGFNSDIIVDAGGTLTLFSAGTLTIQNQAQLFMAGGNATAGTILNNAEIFGNGTVSVAVNLNNNGSISATGGTLNLVATGTGSINLDGNTVFVETGDVNATIANSDIVVTGSLTDAFNGAMTIGNSNSITFNSPWTLGGVPSGTIVFGSDGVMNLNGGTTSVTAAVVAGATATVEGDVNVGTTNFGLFSAPVVFSAANGGATVVCNGTLQFDNNVTYGGGSHTGAGRLIWNDDVSVIGNTTIDVAELDLDGFNPTATLTINNAVVLTVNSLIIDAPSGTINVLGSMIVNGGAWANAGTVILNTGTIGGSSTFSNNATMNVLAGTSSITTNSSFGAASTNTITGTLRLSGDATIAGGAWTGAGTLSLDDQVTTFIGDTTLAMSNFDMDGMIAETGNVNINPLITVTVSGAITDPFNATLDNSGVLAVNGGVWSNSGIVNLTDLGPGTPTIAGKTMSMFGTLNSTGATLVSAPMRGEGGVVNVISGTMIQSGDFLVQAGTTLTKTGAGTMNVTGTQGHGTGTLTVSAGTVILATDAGPVAANLRLNADGSVVFGTTQHLNRLSVGAAGFARLNSGANKVLVTSALVMAGAPPTGKLDLTDNDAIIDYSGPSPLATIQSYLTAGYNGGAWTGNGITSSSAAALAGSANKTALGYGENSVLGLAVFSGEPVDGTSLLIRYVHYGDANLSGNVDTVDFIILAANFSAAGTVWTQADFNYDSLTDTVDFNLLASNFGQLLPGDALDGLGVLVPEPCVAPVALAGVFFLRRRRGATG